MRSSSQPTQTQPLALPTLGGVSGCRKPSKKQKNPMTLKSILKFILETIACGLIGLVFAVLFYNAL
jgi:hypothetical protein